MKIVATAMIVLVFLFAIGYALYTLIKSNKEFTDERLKILLGYVFGFSVLFVYFFLAIAIALGKVEQQTSYGLDMILTAMGPLGGLFCGWAFGKSHNGEAQTKLDTTAHSD